MDMFSYGSQYAPNSQIHTIPDNVRNLIREFAVSRGGELFQKIFIGQITTLPRDAEYEASGLMIKILQLVPAAEASSWLAETLDSLPVNSVSTDEKNKLLQSFTTSVMSGNMKRHVHRLTIFWDGTDEGFCQDVRVIQTQTGAVLQEVQTRAFL